MAKSKAPVPVNQTSKVKEKTALYIEIDVLEGLKYIEYRDDRSRTDIMNEALKDFIAKWEKKNGPVPKKS